MSGQTKPSVRLITFPVRGSDDAPANCTLWADEVDVTPAGQALRRWRRQNHRLRLDGGRELEKTGPGAYRVKGGTDVFTSTHPLAP